MSALPLIVTDWFRRGLWSKWILLVYILGLNVSFLKIDILCDMFIAESSAFRAVSIIQIWEQWAWFLPTPAGNFWQYLETFLVFMIAEEGVLLHAMDGDQEGAAENPAMDETDHSSSRMYKISVVLRSSWESLY